MNGIDGFIAGSFLGTGISAIPDPPTEEIYLRELERHLRKYHDGATPFISVSQKLLRMFTLALRRCREAGDTDLSDWKVAVISLSKVPSLVRAVWDLDAGFNAKWSHGEWVGK